MDFREMSALVGILMAMHSGRTAPPLRPLRLLHLPRLQFRDLELQACFLGRPDLAPVGEGLELGVCRGGCSGGLRGGLEGVSACSELRYEDSGYEE